MKKKKIGRNDPCPCGSGKKYKKCCIDKVSVPNPPDVSLPENPLEAPANMIELIKELKNILSSKYKQKPKRRKHHYVPIWLQKRFLPEGQKSFHYLNLHPFKNLPDGRQVKLREIYNWGPRNCFQERDLYTTKFFGIRNDEIEEYLFGKIDNEGAMAIEALVAQDHRGMSHYFGNIFEFMDAQKLRTPKGLDWIHSNYFQLSRVELLLEMQHLRMMHCTMWVEGVLEIVSAEDSEVKFILSDHPVTIYNYACPLDSEICRYPNDPHTAWKGSQTVFPLDLNHCFIVTNLEYARDPDGSDPLTSRTNPRCFAQTIARWDTIIRERKLKAEEVCAINYVVKTRARKYIASANQAWFYPEKYLPPDPWQSARSVLLPPEKGLWHFGGEIYVGGKDGGLAWYQDEFGRQHTSRENRDDPVRKYSIKRRNQILLNAIYEIFGFAKGKDWDDFRKELTDDKIKELYGVVGGLWNPDTEIMSFLPKPDDTVSALYTGTIDPRIAPLTISAYSLYVDRIIIISPFMNPRAMNKEYSPYESPSKYHSDTIKNVFLIMRLMPLIEAGIVEMIPNPFDFDPYFRKRVCKMAEARLKGRGPNKEDVKRGTKLMRDDFQRSMLGLPPDILRHKIRAAIPDLSEDKIKATIEFMQKLREQDPLASLRPMKPGKKGGQLQISHLSGNLELSLYLAQVTGSYIYTDVNFRWREFESCVNRTPEEKDLDPWAPIVQALNSFHFLMHIGLAPEFICQIKEQGTLAEFINIFRRICNSVRKTKDPNDAQTEAKELAYQIHNIDMELIWNEIDKNYKIFSEKNYSQMKHYKATAPVSFLIPYNGLSSNTITQLILTHGFNTLYWREVPFGAFIGTENIKPI